MRINIQSEDDKINISREKEICFIYYEKTFDRANHEKLIKDSRYMKSMGRTYSL